MTKAEFDILDAVNKEYNRIPYQKDYFVWRKKDYWATPKEFIGKGEGDCEDYAIAKFFALLQCEEIDNALLRLADVLSITKRDRHLVVFYGSMTDKEDTYVLDNLEPEVKKLSEREDLILIFTFDLHNIWNHEGKTVGDARRIRQWDELLKRKEKENDTL